MSARNEPNINMGYLTERQRQVVDLRNKDLSYEEIGKELNISRQGAHTIYISAIDRDRRMKSQRLSKTKIKQLEGLKRKAERKQTKINQLQREIAILEKDIDLVDKKIHEISNDNERR
ncbi:TPA_asm: hypothetical protein GEV19_03005 [Listeria monocytogenes]|nr:hypothetical protein [Listeria monocytogenes]